ncbi:hypothetical protein [Actinomadura sp. HBU206391]|uniref:hypothetical protein n=1 Tax=Actinomadura sp. HBU206391 TaxID=2731692 RepID=UPI00164EF0CD|nr:hypothetical protein [Actinomadura sp. HBU206391]MBC6462356.1 hypothetical protein [Actinomadura sp. HBU206391]
MIDGLATALIVISLAAAAWTLVPAGRDRPIGWSHLAALAVVEAGLLVQAVIAVVKLAGGEQPQDLTVFIGYLVGSLIILPIGGFLGVAERTRWGSVVAGVACLVVPVVIMRMQQIWQGTVG